MDFLRTNDYNRLPLHHSNDTDDSIQQDTPFLADSKIRVTDAPSRSRWQKLRLAAGFIFCLFCIGIAIVFISSAWSDLAIFKPKWTHCGSTVEEAHARGCNYDVMIGSWLLPECSDMELMEQYLAERDWEFYRDQNLTQVLPMDELRRGEHSYPVWATVQQHQYHCAYVWEKQFRSTVAGQLMDDLSASIHHNHHCANGLATGMPGASKNLALAVKYFSCVEPGEGDPRRPNNPNNTLVNSS